MFGAIVAGRLVWVSIRSTVFPDIPYLTSARLMPLPFLRIGAHLAERLRQSDQPTANVRDEPNPRSPVSPLMGFQR
jgi:hypothetical protein